MFLFELAAGQGAWMGLADLLICEDGKVFVNTNAPIWQGRSELPRTRAFGPYLRIHRSESSFKCWFIRATLHRATWVAELPRFAAPVTGLTFVADP